VVLVPINGGVLASRVLNELEHGKHPIFCFSIYAWVSFSFWLICVFALCEQRAKGKATQIAEREEKGEK
jgi:hypothetical protein